MCGPLAVTLGGGAAATAAYQSGRLLSYSLLGSALGATGTWVGTARIETPTAVVSYILAAAIVVLALGGERGVLRIPVLQRLLARATAAGRRLPRSGRALLLGVCTPLLPCGLLWSACAGAAVAGSALQGSVVMGGFALGSLPLLLLAQTRAPALARRFPPHTLAVVQRAAMLLAAVVLVWRGLHASAGGCCH